MREGGISYGITKDDPPRPPRPAIKRTDQMREMTEHQMIEYATRMRQERDEARAQLTILRFVCSHCGFHPDNRAGWCALGCGSDYNQMHKVEL